jgi:hypothetical protein
MLQSLVPAWQGIAVTNTPLRPHAPAESYHGEWRGSLLAQGKQIPITLRIIAVDKGTFAIGKGPAQPIEQLGLTDGALTGETLGDVDAPDAVREQLHQIEFNLKLRGRTIDGEIIAWRKSADHMAVLPYWAKLQRADSGN